MTRLKDKLRARKYQVWVRHPHCSYCGRKLQLKHCSWDHVQPRANGGTTNWRNLIIACVSCNTLKGNMSISEFVKKVELGQISLRRDLPLKMALRQ